ncbi:MAG: glutamine--fructose-6-phosphate transaminase (isomerizing) [Parcubacteria group bacterium]|nr:glutamine--fructose-6-phosphate transaminase (isomerizing) [Parcubacteria group bacterium]
MCGIIGYIGSRNAIDVAIHGIADLEPRGYEAAGLAYVQEGKFQIEKRLREGLGSQTVHPSEQLRLWLDHGDATSNMCIGHTRWPSHGDNTLNNAHPHVGFIDRIAVVHNGTISNFHVLREELSGKVPLRSQTDTELVVHLVARELEASQISLAEAVRRALVHVEGSYAFLFIDRTQPDMIVAAVMGSPLMVGLGDDEVVIASDASAIVRITKRIVDVDDGEVLVIRASGIEDSSHVERISELDPHDIDCEGYDHYMLKEIMEQPRIVRAAMNYGGRINMKRGMPRLGGFRDFSGALARVEHVVLVACGTAYYAALIGKHYLQKIAGIARVDVMIASEADLSNVRAEGSVLIAISQSGETFDTKGVVDEARSRDIFTMGVVNVAASWIARATNCGVYCGAGRETAVASTKVFVSQLTVLYLIAVRLGRMRRLSRPDGKRLLKNLKALPDILEDLLEDELVETAQWIAQNIIAPSDFVAFIGKGMLYPIAMEGSLKLKEITYIPSEGYASGELKHGSLALLSTTRPTVAIIPSDDTFSDVLTAVMEAARTGSPIIVVVQESQKDMMRQILDEYSTSTFDSFQTMLVIPDVPDYLMPIAAVLPLQLLAYFAALALDREIDKPRQLAKSVTVG